MTARLLRLLTWPAAIYAAGILLWYEQYKLTGASGSVYLFTILSDWLFIHGHEQAFRLTVAIAEIIASVLIVLPWTRLWGALFALMIMSGAIFFHLVSPLGIDPYNDGGQLFMEACEVWLCSAFIVAVYHAELRQAVRALLVRRATAWG